MKIELSDTDVEAVTRKVILAKKAHKVPAVDKVVTDLIGEISRHLAGTKVAHRSEDRNVLVPDYPTDLRTGSAELRKRIPTLLAELEESGKVLRAGDEYRLQTRESSAWNDEYRSQIASILGDPQQVASERADLLRGERGKRLKGMKVFQGECREPRSIIPHFGPEEPQGPGSSGVKAIHVWVRDGWHDGERSVLADARAAGNDSPTIFVFIPQRTAEEIRKTLGNLRAAEATLHVRGVPSTPEGHEARQAMETRKYVMV